MGYALFLAIWFFFLIHGAIIKFKAALKKRKRGEKLTDKDRGDIIIGITIIIAPIYIFCLVMSE